VLNFILRDSNLRFYSFLLVLSIVLGALVPSVYTSIFFLVPLAIVSIFAGAITAFYTIKYDMKDAKSLYWRGLETMYASVGVALFLLFVASIAMEATFCSFDGNGWPTMDGTRLALLWLGFYGGMALQAYRLLPAVRLVKATAETACSFDAA
jgi:hypothetical protein